MWVVITDTNSDDGVIFLVNREITTDRWWTHDLLEAKIFKYKKAVENYVKSLKYRNPRMMTYKKAQKLMAEKSQYKLDLW